MKSDSLSSHIVMIEDNPSDVYLTKVALEESGVAFELTNFKSGADALLTLCPVDGKVDSLVPDLILLDLNTPRSDGFEVLATIRGNARLANVPVAIVTSSESPADKRRAAQLGATSYIQKPTQLTAYIEGVGNAIKQLLAKKAGVSGAI
jgi:CheY-like chemotaxis protein